MRFSYGLLGTLCTGTTMHTKMNPENIFSHKLKTIAPYQQRPDTDVVIRKYNEVVKSEQNLDDVTNPLYLTLYSILCQLSHSQYSFENPCSQIIKQRDQQAKKILDNLLDRVFGERQERMHEEFQTGQGLNKIYNQQSNMNALYKLPKSGNIYDYPLSAVVDDEDGSEHDISNAQRNDSFTVESSSSQNMRKRRIGDIQKELDDDDDDDKLIGISFESFIQEDGSVKRPLIDRVHTRFEALRNSLDNDQQLVGISDDKITDNLLIKSLEEIFNISQSFEINSTALIILLVQIHQLLPDMISAPIELTEDFKDELCYLIEDSKKYRPQESFNELDEYLRCKERMEKYDDDDGDKIEMIDQRFLELEEFLKTQTKSRDLLTNIDDNILIDNYKKMFTEEGFQQVLEKVSNENPALGELMVQIHSLIQPYPHLPPLRYEEFKKEICLLIKDDQDGYETLYNWLKCEQRLWLEESGDDFLTYSNDSMPSGDFQDED